MKKVLSVVSNVLLYLFILFAFLTVLLTITSKKTEDGAAILFGHSLRFVISDSMAAHPDTDVSEYKIKDIPIKSLIVVENIPEDAQEQAQWYSELKIGDVLTFRYLYHRQQTITHRIVNIEDNGRGGYLITLEGDNKGAENQNTLTQSIDTSDDPATSYNYVLGKVVGVSKVIGNIVHVLKEPLGIVFIIILPCLMIIVYEVMKIVNTFSAEKKAKQRAEAMEKEREIERLRERLTILEGTAKSEKPSGLLPENPNETASVDSNTDNSDNKHLQ